MDILVMIFAPVNEIANHFLLWNVDLTDVWKKPDASKLVMTEALIKIPNNHPHYLFIYFWWLIVYQEHMLA